MRVARIVLAAVGVSTLACSTSGPLPEERQTREEAIYYGSLDTTHQAVVSVSAGGGMCTGTIVAVNGSSGYVLTAAHCLVSWGTQTYPPNQVSVRIGNNYNTPTATYTAAAVKVHPLYDGDDGSANDFGMIRFTGATSSTPVIPAMAPAQDNLAVGTQVDLVGYGQTESSYNNSQRRHIVKPIADLNSAWLIFNQTGTSGGTCSGDSGGPALSLGTERVAGVTSFGTGGTCTEDGYSGRVSTVYDSFIKPFIDGTTGQISCTECQNSVTAGNGACIPTINACYSNTSCNNFINCINACTTTTCQNQCAQSNPTGADLYMAILDCMCDECQPSCANDPMCVEPQCGFNLNDATCGGCSDSKCCAQEQACADNAACVTCVSTSNPPSSCSSNTQLNNWDQCLTTNCATECGISTTGCGFTSTDVACQTCFEGECCDEAKACAADTTCVTCVTSATPPAGCDTNALAQGFEGCVSDKCAAECGGGTGGTGGMGGVSGSGGTGGTAGTGGDAGTGGVGGGSAGTAGSGGSAGTAGVGAEGGSAGTAGSGGGPSGSGGTTTPPGDEEESGGCGCSTVGHDTPTKAWLLLGLALAFSRRIRRRRAA
jgi:MYXO-CTERM domain-containing protein